ncbi:MAG: OsmC family protein [Bacteroidia bacterium]|nr:OsmC family protein [Bacteroidia bacterium]
MRINIKRTDDDFKMEAVNEDGNSLLMDASPDIGGHGKGMRPMQLLLSALGGCSAIDIILILKKQKQEIESFEIEVDGDREKTEDVSLFKNIALHFKIKGKVDKDKAERAVQLSVDKYCSVAKTLEATAKITYKVTVN